MLTWISNHFPHLAITCSAIASMAAGIIKANETIKACEFIIHGNIFQVAVAFFKKQPVLRALQVVQKEKEMGLFRGIENDFVTVGKWAEKELADLGGLIEAGAKQFCNEFGPAVLSAANVIVPALAEYATGLSGADKFKVASAAIGKTLEQQGIQVGVQVGTSMINSAIEHVVASLQQPAAAQTTQSQGTQSTRSALAAPAPDAAILPSSQDQDTAALNAAA